MSEQRKRLMDAERERDWTTVNKYIPNHTPPCEAVARLVADGDQAREDRKRLAERLRQVSSDGHDHRCASQRFQPFGPQPKCDCETGRLLAEVDPQ